MVEGYGSCAMFTSIIALPVVVVVVVLRHPLPNVESLGVIENFFAVRMWVEIASKSKALKMNTIVVGVLGTNKQLDNE